MSERTTTRTRLLRLYISDLSNAFYIVCALLAAAWLFLGQGRTAPELPRCLGWVSAGWLLYLVEEYLSHVFVFHAPVPRNKWVYLARYRLHLGHHDRPRRVDLLFTPIWYTLPMLSLNALAFYFATRDAVVTLELCLGLVCGYLFFEWCHLLIHAPFRTGAILSHVRRLHHGHHHWNEHRWFALSPPAVVLDLMFGTGGAIGSTQRGLDPERSGVAESDPRLVLAREWYSQSDGTPTESRLWRPRSVENAP